MAASLTKVVLHGTRSTANPSATWGMGVDFVPHNLQANYRIRFTLRDRALPPLVVGRKERVFSAADSETPQQLQLDRPVPAAAMTAGAIGDGPPWNRVDLVAQLDIFDGEVSDQNPIGTWVSPGLDIYLD